MSGWEFRPSKSRGFSEQMPHKIKYLIVSECDNAVSFCSSVVTLIS